MLGGVLGGFGGIIWVGGMENHRCLPVALLAGLALIIGMVFYVIGLLLTPPHKPKTEAAADTPRP